jgi:peptidoglycan/LPS O-acetylase OafA/YrhL
MASGTFNPAPRAELSRVPYLPGLDGMRAIAVVAVMLYHANHEWLGGGFLGVEVFFVISGYLITLLLIGEHERSGHVDLKQFWIRRFRRLLPALVTMLVLVAVYVAAFYPKARGRVRGDFISATLYSANWYQIFVGQGYSASEAFVPLRHLWSLAVEEQFYLLWPLVMLVILRRSGRNLPRVGLRLIGASVVIAIAVAVLYAPGDVASVCSPEAMNGYWNLFGRCISVNDALYLGSFSRAGGLMLGAGFAMLWRPMAIMRGPLRDKGRQLDVFAFAGLALLALLMVRLTVQGSGRSFGVRFDPWLFRGGFFFTGLATLLIIAAATHSGAATGKLLGNKVFLWVGTRSYGLYLYHWPIYQIIRKSAGVLLSPWQFILAMIITVPITEASYRFIETPIRKGRLMPWLRSFSLQRASMVAGVMVIALVAISTFSILRADNRCVGDVECSLEAARESQVTDPPVVESSIPSSTDAAVVPTQPGDTTASVVTTTTIPKAPVPYLAVGDSVMAGAQPFMIQDGVLTDGAEARQASGVVKVLQGWRASGDLGQGSTVVVQVGTNGEVDDAAFARIMAELPPEQNPLVVFLTIKADPKVATWAAGNNVRIRALPTLYPNVKIADWETVAATLELCPDGAHISCPGGANKAYRNMIYTAINRPDLVKP